MKKITLILVLLLIVNCTTDSPDSQDELSTFRQQVLSCVDDDPQIKITNNGTIIFDVAVYGEDYSEVYSESLSIGSNTDWFDSSNTEIIIVASNNNFYGRKIQLSLLPCDIIEVEIDANNNLIISGE